MLRLRPVQIDKQEAIVTILAPDLHRYMAITGMALVRKFDFTRYQKGFVSWNDAERTERRSETVAYHAGAQSGASFANGVQIIRAATTRAILIEDRNRKGRQEGKQYASFISFDVKKKRLAELSCAPKALASYFEPDSPLPLQITPAFFRPDVLQKYKADPDKYTLEHRSISSRAGWTLETYDINEAGQVHTYLWYLGELPHSEQFYWKSFNEEPKATYPTAPSRPTFWVNGQPSRTRLSP